ncbi:hypothetical protein [Streptomyces sp. NPDC007074]|uniref:hypothetical protein n=1 Tax=Streptomyces sp. NPDC007074 TaxID=3156764 RepID=UPI0033D86BF0
MKSRLRATIAALLLTTAVAAGITLADNAASPQGDTTWGAPAGDTTWGAPAPDRTVIAPLDTTWG